jgi:D-alanyl-D-alanine carboxypeptidase
VSVLAVVPGARLLVATVLGAVLLTAVFVPAPAAGAPGWPAVDARSVVVMDAGSGRILYARAPDERRLIASTTKIMTALVAIERGNPDDLVTVSRRAATVEGSRIYLEEGERETLRDLLYALMLRSANDAAIAIAEHIAGSVEQFAELMNEKASSLGCRNTHFVNPHGLDATGHYSTARDLAVIAAYAMKNPVFRQVVSTRRWQMPWPAKNSTRVLYNENRLLAHADGTGIKTGYTVAAGHCVVASARRGAFEPVVVMLGAGLGFWRDVRALLDHAFACYRPVTIVRAGEPLASRSLCRSAVVEGAAGADAVVPLLPEEATAVDGKVKTTVRWDPVLSAPVEKGQKVGEVQVEVECPGVPLLTVPLVATRAVAVPQHSPARPWLAVGAMVAGLLIWRRRRIRRVSRGPRRKGNW